MILYFSGTGNSRYVARAIAKLTGDSLVSMNERIKMRDHSPLHSSQPFVFVMPTYAWRMPRIIHEHILQTEFTGCEMAYFIMTCGDSTGNAVAYIKELCKIKTFTFCGVASVIMPENYIAMYSVPDKATAGRIIQMAVPGIVEIAGRIIMGKQLKDLHPTITGILQSGLVNPLFYAYINDRGFRFTNACISCGKCAELCPLNNIQIVDGAPRWGGNCTHCMACICGCPTEAIEYANASKGKPRYYLTEEPEARIRID